MSFTSKNLQTKRKGMSFIKGATLFFLGMSCVLFIARAFDISAIAPNAVQYIGKIFLTNDGSSTSPTMITLDGNIGGGITIANLQNKSVLGTDGNGKITGASANVVYNLISGLITGLPGGSMITGMSFNTNNNMLTLYISGASAVTGIINLSGVTNWNSGYSRTNTSGNVLRNRYTNTGINITNPLWTMNGNNMYNNNRNIGNVGIGLTSPTYKLTLSGNMLFDQTASRTIKMQDISYPGRLDFSIIGSNASGGSNNGGNVGGHIYVQAGNGGTASVGLVGGDGGNIYLNGGSPGFGTSGLSGQVIMANEGGKTAVGTGTATAMLTVEGGIRPKIRPRRSTDQNPCLNAQSDYLEGTIYYSEKNQTICYCNGSNQTIKVTNGSGCN